MLGFSVLPLCQEKNLGCTFGCKFFLILLLFQVPIPITESLDPLTMLTDNAQIAQWQNEGLPSDRMSTENATILTNCERWPLMIDPQLQGIKWIKRKYGDTIQIVRLDQKGMMGMGIFIVVGNPKF